MHELRAVRRIHYQTWQRYFETVQFIIETKIEFVKQNILVAIFCNILFTVFNTHEKRLRKSLFILLQYYIFQDV